MLYFLDQDLLFCVSPTCFFEFTDFYLKLLFNFHLSWNSFEIASDNSKSQKIRKYISCEWTHIANKQADIIIST